MLEDVGDGEVVARRISMSSTLAEIKISWILRVTSQTGYGAIDIIMDQQNSFPTRTLNLRHKPAFTLVELLTVIAIIAILAAMTLVVIAQVQKEAKKKKAQLELQGIVTAVTAYEADYSHFPISSNEQAVVGTNDFTTGMMSSFGTAPAYSYDNNSNVVAILMDLEYFPNGDATVNLHHVKNVKQVAYLTAKISGYDPKSGGSPLPGVDNTGIYRDPWGNPYVISMDTSYDNQCSDLLYSLQAVSQSSPGSTAGFNGLANTTDPGGAGNHFLYHGRVMAWSAGPDGKIDTSPANAGFNKDNVLSW